MPRDDRDIMAMENANPYFHLKASMNSKFIPYILAINVGGMKITEATVKILMILFCSMLIKPKKVFCKYSNRSKLKLV